MPRLALDWCAAKWQSIVTGRAAPDGVAALSGSATRQHHPRVDLLLGSTTAPCARHLIVWRENHHEVRHGLPCEPLLCAADQPDRLEVMLDGVVVLDVPMGIGGPLHPESAEAARSRPWFYTGSPYSAEIVELARKRGEI